MNKADKKMLNDQVDALDTVKTVLDEYRSEQQDVYNELSEKLHGSDKEQALLAVLEQLETACDNIDYAMQTITDVLGN